MGVFDVFKKKENDVPPDVGKEEVLSSDDNSEDSTGLESDELGESEEDELDNAKPVPKSKTASEKKSARSFDKKTVTSNSKNYVRTPSADGEMQNLVLEKIEARIEAGNAVIKGLNERFALINQQIGELRAGHLENEKTLSKLSVESAKSIDIVKEVKPEKLRFDFQKVDMRVDELSQKIESNKQFMESILNEVKELRRESSFFAGSEAVVKLNDEVKKDLIATQQLAAKTRMHADKSEQIFIEMKGMAAENQKTLGFISNLDTNYSGLKKDFEKLNLDFQNIATKKEVADLKKYADTRLFAFDQVSSELMESQEDHARLIEILESIAGIVNQNKQDINDIAMTIGERKIKKVTDYDEMLISILHVMDALAGQIVKIKKAVGIKITGKGKIKALPAGKKKAMNENLGMKHIEVHPKLSKSLLPSVPQEQEAKSQEQEAEEQPVEEQEAEEQGQEQEERPIEEQEAESEEQPAEEPEAGEKEQSVKSSTSVKRMIQREEGSFGIEAVRKQISELIKRGENRKTNTANT